MSAEDEAAYVAELSEEERHCVVGLGGSQKAEVAWMDKMGMEYDEHDVEKFFADMSDSMEKVEIFLKKLCVFSACDWQAVHQIRSRRPPPPVSKLKRPGKLQAAVFNLFEFVV